MPRFVRQVLGGTVLMLIGCSVYDASLLVGGTSSSGTGADGNGATGGSLGGSGGSLGGSGGVGGGSGGDAGKPNTGGTKSGGSGGSGGAGGSSSTSGAGGSNGGSVSKGGSAGVGATGGDAMGGAEDSGGGMGDGADAGMGNPGQGGTGSAAGAGGTGGSAAGASNAGTTSAAGSGGTGGASTTASGCAVLSASLAADTDKTHYLMTLGTSDVDFSSAVISVHLYTAGTGGGVFLYVQEATYEFFAMPPRAISAINGWTTLTWDLSAETATTPLDKTKVRRLGIEIDGTGSTAWTNPTLAYIDSITVTSPTLAFTFDATSSVYKTPTSSYSTDTALWLNSASDDTTATGSTVDWAASCP